MFYKISSAGRSKLLRTYIEYEYVSIHSISFLSSPSSILIRYSPRPAGRREEGSF